MTGFIIMFVFAVFFLSISTLIARKYAGEGVDGFIVAGRNMPFGFITASVMVSWIWTMTIVGAAEAGMVYGISGGINYSWGAFIPFFVFIPLVMLLRKKMPRCTTFVEFIRIRYGKKMSLIYISFALMLTFYILLSQGIGLGIVFNALFGMPYKFAAAIPIVIVSLYVSRSGLKGSIVNDVIMFFIISIILLISVPIILKTIGMDTIYNGMVDAATNTANANYNPDALNLFSSSGFRYGIVALVVAMGQVMLDQGYYSKAVSTANTKSLLIAFLVGTILAWAPVPLLSGNVFGSAALGVGASVSGGELSITSDAAPYIFKLVFGNGFGSILFSLMIFMAGLTTGADILAGAQAIFTIDIYKKYIKKEATEAEQTRFGKRMTLAIGLFMAVVVMFFEGKSILQIDIFSGIIFAAPCAPFIIGLVWKKVSSKTAIASILIGLSAGIAAYFLIPDENINYFIANLCSLLVPALVIAIGSLFSRHNFNYALLQEYVPDHQVHINE